jgi:hypothetical protein
MLFLLKQASGPVLGREFAGDVIGLSESDSEMAIQRRATREGKGLSTLLLYTNTNRGHGIE